MLNKPPKTCHYYSFFFLTTPHPPCNYYDYYYFYMQRLKESCNFLASVSALPWAQKVEEKEGDKTRNKFFRKNTIPNSQYNINFGWWLTFLFFCLDEQIYYKKTNTYGSWLHRLLAKSELLSLTRTIFFFFLIIHLLNSLYKNSLLRTYTIHHVFVNSDWRGKKLLLLQQFAFRRN